VVFVPAGEAHRFTEIAEDLALIVVFAPPYGSRAPSLGELRPAGRLCAGAYTGWAALAASSMPRRASSSACSLPGSPA
jgi:hypothetical protein